MKRVSFVTYVTVGVLFHSLAALSSICAQGGIMTFEEYAKVSHAVPYIVELKIGKGSLLYFGSKHSYDPRDPQSEQIQKLWKSFGPDVVFYESTGTSVEKTIDESVSRGGEPGLVRFLASQNKVQARTLEPNPNDEVTLMLKSFSVEQVKFFFVLRQVPQFRERKSDENIESFMTTMLRNISYYPGLAGPPNSVAELDKLALWLAPRLKDWRSADRSWSDPVASYAYTNLIARNSSEFRDANMIKLLTDEVARGKRVFAVVGASHVVMQEPALRIAARAQQSK